jgi:2-(1,2-epoxy-1,2-dihydrophenyl)acetyl-CoA isomerase
LVRESKPMVAAINGAAIGLGLSQVLPMDYLVAASGARLSARFVRMGLVPELASSHFLGLRCGFGQASRLMLTGCTVTAEEALAMGLVDQVAPPEKLLDCARDMARQMGENPQVALAMVKSLITDNFSDGDTDRVQRRELQALGRCFISAEHREAVAAFLEKRPPDFRRARTRA